MMNVVERILSPVSETWVAWVMMSLLCMMLLNRAVLGRWLQLWHGLFSHSDRMYNGSLSQSVFSVLLSYVFRIGVMAMFGYVLMYDTGTFAWLTYLKIVGIVFVLLVVQWLLWELVSYVFLPPAQRKNAWEQRTTIYNAICVLLWLIVLVMIEVPNTNLKMLFLIVFLVLLLGMLVFRGMQMFYQRPWTILYVLLYVITLEVLPLLGGIIWAKQVI